MNPYSGNVLLGLSFILLLSSAEAIHMRSTIEATKRLHGHEQVHETAHDISKEVQSWTNSELMQLRGQVKSLTLHFQFLSDAVTDQSAADIKIGVKKLTEEVHNCKEMFSRITEFSSNANSCPADEFGPDCVSSDILDELSDSISKLFKDPFLDKITDNLGVYSQSKDSNVQNEMSKIRKTIHVSDDRGDASADEEDQGEMRRLTGCLSALDKELVEETPSPKVLDEALTKAPHATTAATATVPSDDMEVDRFLENRVVVRHDTPGSLLIKGIMSMIIGVPLVAFGILLSMALVFVFAVIYAVASFLGLKSIAKSQDTLIENTVNHAMKKLNTAIDWVVPREGIKIGTIRREGLFRL